MTELEMKTETEEFTDELSDEALDRTATEGARASTAAQFSACRQLTASR